MNDHRRAEGQPNQLLPGGRVANGPVGVGTGLPDENPVDRVLAPSGVDWDGRAGGDRRFRNPHASVRQVHDPVGRAAGRIPPPRQRGLGEAVAVRRERGSERRPVLEADDHSPLRSHRRVPNDDPSGGVGRGDPHAVGVKHDLIRRAAPGFGPALDIPYSGHLVAPDGRGPSSVGGEGRCEEGSGRSPELAALLPGGLPGRDPAEHVVRVRTGERGPKGEQFVGGGAERVDVRPGSMSAPPATCSGLI